MLELVVAQKVGRWGGGGTNKTTKAMQKIYSSSFLKLELVRVVVEHKHQHLLAKGLSRLRK